MRSYSNSVSMNARQASRFLAEFNVFATTATEECQKDNLDNVKVQMMMSSAIEIRDKTTTTITTATTTTEINLFDNEEFIDTSNDRSNNCQKFL